jgi:preprotein translocase subunit SecG
MYAFLIAVHVIVCILLTIVILLQSSKGGGLAGVFGGGSGMNAVFGGRGAGTFLSRATTVLAIIFMVLAMFLGLITRGNQRPSSIVSQERGRASVASPADVLPTVPTDGEATTAPEKTAPAENAANPESK